MRNLATLTAAALLWGTATFASGYADVITRAFTSAGYTNVQVSRTGSDWLVSAVMNGQPVQFVVDPDTGRSQRSSDDGAGHDIGDDHGQDGAGHDLNDDHGEDGPGHDLNDDHGEDGPGHDLNDDHGGDRDDSDDQGGDDSGHDGGHDGSHDGSDHD